jgi:hypothetical protein
MIVPQSRSSSILVRRLAAQVLALVSGIACYTLIFLLLLLTSPRWSGIQVAEAAGVGVSDGLLWWAVLNAPELLTGGLSLAVCLTPGRLGTPFLRALGLELVGTTGGAPTAMQRLVRWAGIALTMASAGAPALLGLIIADRPLHDVVSRTDVRLRDSRSLAAGSC